MDSLASSKSSMVFFRRNFPEYLSLNIMTTFQSVPVPPEMEGERFVKGDKETWFVKGYKET